MSSEENKSKFEKINNINSSNPTKKEEENHEKDNLIKQNLISSKTSSKQKNETITNLSDSNITTRQNNEINQPFNFPQPESNSSLNENSKFTYFQSKKINILDKRENQDKPCCCCTKTKCIKKYCECFANNRFCQNCLCLDCRNKDIFMGAGVYNSEKRNKNKEIVVCTCSKSGCNKKYCECYKEGLKCNIKCRCINCLNVEEPLDKSHNDSNKIISIEETKSESGKKMSKNELDCFNIQRISIYINKSQTLINVEKLAKEEFSLLCKKRKKAQTNQN